MPPDFSDKISKTGTEPVNTEWQEALAILVYGKAPESDPGAQIRQQNSARQTMATELEKFCNTGFSLVDKNADGKLSYAELSARPMIGANSNKGILEYLRKEFDSIKVISDDEMLWESAITPRDLTKYRADAARILVESTAKGCVKAIQDGNVASLQSVLMNASESPQSVAKLIQQKLASEHSGATCSYRTEKIGDKEIGQFTVSLKGWKVSIPTEAGMKPMAWHETPGGFFRKAESIPMPADKALNEINSEIKRERDRKNFYMDPLPWITQ